MLCYYKSKSWLSNSGPKKKKKKNGAHFYRPPVILLRGTQDIAIEHQVLCSNTVKKNESKTYISLKENKLVSFINS